MDIPSDNPTRTTLAPTTSPTTTTEELTVHPTILWIFIVYYFLVFISGFIGNICIITSVYKFKRMRNVVNIFLVNLALSDLLFIILSTFDFVTFLRGKWILGDVACRIQGTLIEMSYTVSVSTLTVVAVERYLSICYPYKPKRTMTQAVKICVLIWIFAILFCTCLLYGYSLKPDEKNKLQCSNTTWGNTSRLAFYVVHSVVVYLFPLTIMIFSHVKISQALRNLATRNKVCKQTSHEMNCNIEQPPPTIEDRKSSEHGTLELHIKNRKESMNYRFNIVKLLAVVTIIFFILWTPFITVRLIMYMGVHVNEIIWRATQLLIFGNTTINCFIYAFMSPTFREAFKHLLTCKK